MPEIGDYKQGRKLQLKYEQAKIILNGLKSVMISPCDSQYISIRLKWKENPPTVLTEIANFVRKQYRTCQTSIFISHYEFDHIEDWYWSKVYRKKFLDYSKLARVLRTREDFNDQDHRTIGTRSTTTQKLPILERIIALANQLSQEYNRAIENDFKTLEGQLILLLDLADFQVLYNPGGRKKPNTFLDFLYNELRLIIISIIPKLHGIRKRDVRTELREIVRFHFKNMDDEIDVNGIFNTVIKNFKLSNSLFPWIINRLSSTLKTC